MEIKIGFHLPLILSINFYKCMIFILADTIYMYIDNLFSEIKTI